MTAAPIETDRSRIQHLDGRLRDLLAGKKIVMTGVTGFIGEQLLWKILDRAAGDHACGAGTPQGLGHCPGPDDRRREEADLRRRSGRCWVEQPSCSTAGLRSSRAICPTCRSCPPTSTSWCIAPATYPSTRRSTRHLHDQRDRHQGAAGSACCRLSPTRTASARTVPHYVHISTAYTAGRRRGAIPEAPHVHNIDYDAEAAAGIAMRDLIEAESRTSARLAKLRKEAEREHRQAGFLTTAADTERRRIEWVQAELVKAGTERARSLGWTDVYTFTKALGERVVADVGRDVTGLDRPAGNRRVVLAASVSRLDRGLQDGRAADLGVRARRASGVSGDAGGGRRHRAL